MLSWICVDTVTQCPGVIDPEGAQAHAIHSSQTLTFHMMLATKHHFHGIQERANVFIPLEFRDLRDIRPRWRTALFQYLDRVWEWVQVMSDHVASHYTLLANTHGAKPAQSPAHHQVLTVTPPTECSMAINLPSAWLSHKGGATTRPKGSVRNVTVNLGSSNPPGLWNSWDEYLQDKPGELNPNQIIGVVAQNQCKIKRSIARILELFNWFSSSRMVSIIGHFDRCVGSEAKGGEGQRWRRALVDFAYRNITFDMKQLVEVLRCDLQVTIQEGLMETQTELLKTIAGFMDHFQMEMITLSPPQMYALLDHLHTRWAGGQALLDVIRHGNTSTRPESFLDKSPSHLLQSFFDSLPDHQVDINRDSTALTQMEVEVNNTAAALRACMTDVCADPTLMLNLEPSVQGVTTIDLT